MDRANQSTVLGSIHTQAPTAQNSRKQAEAQTHAPMVLISSLRGSRPRRYSCRARCAVVEGVFVNALRQQGKTGQTGRQAKRLAGIDHKQTTQARNAPPTLISLVWSHRCGNCGPGATIPPASCPQVLVCALCLHDVVCAGPCVLSDVGSRCRDQRCERMRSFNVIHQSIDSCLQRHTRCIGAVGHLVIIYIIY